MSVSSTRVRTCTDVRSAIFMSTVPPLTACVGDVMTMPGSTAFSRIVPAFGARTLVSSSVMRAFSSATSELDDWEAAFANSSSACLHVDLRERLRFVELVRAIELRLRDRAARLRAARARPRSARRQFRGVRLSISTSSCRPRPRRRPRRAPRAPRPTPSTSLRRATRARRCPPRPP